MTMRKKPSPKTDARKAPNLEEWAWQWRPELMPVGRFIDSVENGETPAFDDMQKIAGALRAFFCHRDSDASAMAFCKALGLPKKSGSRPMTWGESKHAAGAAISIAKREAELIAEGASERIATAQSIREFVAATGGNLRTVQSWFQEYRELGRMAAKFIGRATQTRVRAAR